MRIVMAVASKYGSTMEIGEAIAGELRSAGHEVHLHAYSRIGSLAEYDAAVLGSAIYMGNWLADARQFVERHEAELAAMPVWMFSSGPLGEEQPVPAGEPAGTTAIVAGIRPREHRLFTGSLDPGELSFGERLAVKMVKAPKGDYRHWDEIRAWARGIAAELETAAIA